MEKNVLGMKQVVQLKKITGVNIHPIEPRVITVREMARLQSFSDDFIFFGSKAKQMVQIGNAVPPLMAKAIGLAIKKSIQG